MNIFYFIVCVILLYTPTLFSSSSSFNSILMSSFPQSLGLHKKNNSIPNITKYKQGICFASQSILLGLEQWASVSPSAPTNSQNLIKIIILSVTNFGLCKCNHFVQVITKNSSALSKAHKSLAIQTKKKHLILRSKKETRTVSSINKQ